MAKALVGKSEWLYADIACVRVRSRPLHLDVRFHKYERLRMCSAEIQAIVIEFFHRSGPGLQGMQITSFRLLFFSQALPSAV